MGRKTSRINIDGQNLIQKNLFAPIVNRAVTYNAFPKLTNTVDDFRRLLATYDGPLGFDTEFPTDGPKAYKATILGIATPDEACAFFCKPEHFGELVADAKKRQRRLVCHSFGAERRCVYEAIGEWLPVEFWEDSMLDHYLLNQDLCKAPEKSMDEEEQGGIGFMGLWPMAHLNTLLSAWKQCPGRDCEQIACPRCNPRGYCAVDAYASLNGHLNMNEEFENMGYPSKVRREILELAIMCEEMQTKGMKINMEYMIDLEKNAEEKKAQLFPFEKVGKEVVWKLFNPRSSTQIIDWFKTKGIQLPSTEKKEVFNALEKQADKLGFSIRNDKNKVTLTEFENAPTLPQEAEAIFKLYQLKDSGKGLDAWISDKYRDAEDLIHSRFIVTGTSTTRLSSASPNCFDGDTEVLTNQGWRFLKDISEDTFVAQWEDGKMTFVRPRYLTRRAYSGEMITLRNQHIDLRVTADHRCLLIQRKTGKHFVLPAVEYKQDYLQINAGQYEGGVGVALSDDMIRLLVATQADGSYANATALDFSFSRKRKIARFREMLKRIGADFREQVRKPIEGKSQVIRFYVNGSVSKIVREYLGADKQFGSWVLWLSRRQLDIFVDEIRHWDGAYRGHMYASRDSVNADWVQAAMVLSDRRTNIRVRVNNSGSVSHQTDISKDRNYSMTTNVTKTFEVVTNEVVYCLSVPSSYVLVRRNGTVCITGQCQNIPARGFGALVRGGIVPRSADLDYLKADFSQLELRMVLYLSGLDPASIGKDAFTWLVENSDKQFEKAAALYAKKARDIAKETSHSCDYGEGIKFYTPEELERSRTKSEIEYGALRVYLKKYNSQLKRDWDFGGLIVAFTGANRAEALFRDKSYESRRKALEIQEDIYCARFPTVREWQYSVLEQVFNNGCVKYPTGHFLRLYGSPEDNAKMGFAALGQGVSAQHVQGIMLRFRKEQGVIPVSQIHDELLTEIPSSWSDDEAREFISLMGEETDRLSGFKSAFKAYRGKCWLEGSDDNQHIPGVLRQI
jgi:hypothetical protein